MKDKEVIIIGGGLAGLTSAIHLSKLGHSVTVIEKNTFPKHKVCGEYISNEVLPYLNWLNLNIAALNPTNITKLEFSTASGKTIKSILPLGGFGISRFALDEYLYRKAIKNGCTILQGQVENILYEDDKFTITTTNAVVLQSEMVIGAFGKRSNIDQKMNRNFIHKKSYWLAVKAHYSGEFPNDLVGLHNFKGGYCGVSKVENGVINICYLADYKTFKTFKNITEYQTNIVSQNPHLKAIFNNSTLLFQKPLTISQISFEKKKAVENHILMIGDTAGLIHPLCGNGMAMAIHSAKIASELILEYYSNKPISRESLEKKYTKEWNLHFGKRIYMGRILAQILTNKTVTNALVSIVASFPGIMRSIIKQTHGKTIAIN